MIRNTNGRSSRSGDDIQMIKKYIDRLFGRRESVTHKDARPVIHSKEKHGIGRESISKCARRTCEELQRAGYLAFVVGGAVRDLLVGMHPKDFDVATSATPEEVRSIFRRSRIIGRRFQIVHVLCGAATLGFTIDPETRAPIHALKHLLENVPQARLFEEILKMLLSGNAVECVRLLRELELHRGLLPLLDWALDDADTGPFAMAALRA